MSATFKEDALDQQIDFTVSQGLLVQLWTWVWGQKSLLRNMLGTEFGQQSTLNTNTHPESENANVVWKIASKCAENSKHPTATSPLNAARSCCWVLLPSAALWGGEKQSVRCKAGEQGSIWMFVVLLHEGAHEFRGSKFPFLQKLGSLPQCLSGDIHPNTTVAFLNQWRKCAPLGTMK